MESSKLNFSTYMAKNTLDITSLTERGEALKQAIFNAVKDTQAIIMAPLPNELIMTAAQYEDQDPLGDMAQAYKSKDRVYITPLNAMDIVVKDPENFTPEPDVIDAPSDDPDFDEVKQLLRKEGTLSEQ